ncbi:unnamed protein product [Pleuronectes platessa]|uniref:LRAT domain-containing protein n=1 Tax=Pleuronectes platessa TaxID=8262 RepID=A0A9N7VXL5_PLEPL|nr:unnamed protein product [Pleuronectes platessa]
MAQTFNGKPGDLIEIFRGICKHWAVYIGGQMVVHFVTDGGQSSGSSANPSSSTGKVKREKLTDVVGNDRYQINNLLDDNYEDRKLSVIVKEARDMVGRVLQYNVVSYNSEHFAAEMRYGKARSRQLQGKLLLQVEPRQQQPQAGTLTETPCQWQRELWQLPQPQPAAALHPSPGRSAPGAPRPRTQNTTSSLMKQRGSSTPAFNDSPHASVWGIHSQ